MNTQIEGFPYDSQRQKFSLHPFRTNSLQCKKIFKYVKEVLLLAILKVAIVTNTDLNAGFGVENWIRTVSEYFSRHVQITIINRNKECHNVNYVLELQNSGINVIGLEFDLRFPKRTAKYIILTFRSLFAVDVIYFVKMNCLLGIIVSFVNFLKNIPIIIGHHIPDYGSSKKLSQKLFNFLMGNGGRKIWERFPFHHVLTSEEANKVDLKGRTVYQIPNGITQKLTIPPQKYSIFTVMYAGRLDYQKGADKLEELVKLLDKDLGSYRFIIIGSGILSNSIRLLSLKYEAVSYRGFVSESEREEIMHRSHVLIFPSIKETFGLVPLEAMAHGTPAISMDINGPRDYISDGDDGFLVNSLEEMEQQVKIVFNMFKCGTYDNLAEKARLKSIDFDWNIILPNLLKMFDEVLHNSYKFL